MPNQANMNLFKSKVLIFLIIFLIPVLSFAQYEDEIPDNEKTELEKTPNKMKERKPLDLKNFFVGSGLSFQFWGNQFRTDILPYFGYRIGDILAPAVGFSYIYAYNFQDRTSMHVYGPRALLRLRPFKNFRALEGIYLQGEYEYLVVDAEDPYYNPNNPNGNPKFQRFYQPRTNVGFGYTSNFGKGFGVTSEILFDLYSLNNRSLFTPFIYRVTFYYGF
jgi:hypothetical protein